MKAILGRKMGMTQVFSEDGTMYPVTVVEVLPNIVTDVKTLEKHGYVAVQVGYEDKKASRANKPEMGIAKKANTTPHQVHAELRGDEMANYKLGDAIKADLFNKGDVVDIIGTAKGHGFSGTIKRWNGHIGPKGHGSGYHRGQGSFANNGRYNHGVMPGKHMAGHYGNESSTLLNVYVIDVNVENNYILIKGGIPGAKKSIVTIRSAIKDVRNPKTIKNLLVRKSTETPLVEEVAVAEEAKAE
ncbi:MAG: 50S ribosomal protein L3 [Erysipelotrichaceae bacterium]|jgi:large subunit ribosomal protein L3|nr:50S ribosomal protein L3 [Erysipelotrichaceae bacterium]HPY79674.1 50S ribosomal protein L3 [Bacilli bacterium]HQA55686.1 50S ribosomal protein L3 [Bacilli bacterium]